MGLVQRKKLSKAGGMTPSGPRCPQCGGSQFEAVRSVGQKMDAVIFLPAFFFQRKKDIACVACGAKFSRG